MDLKPSSTGSTWWDRYGLVWGFVGSERCLLRCMLGLQVKEKETARKEYKQAVESGHGAYLMDQDAPVRPLPLPPEFSCSLLCFTVTLTAGRVHHQRREPASLRHRPH